MHCRQHLKYFVRYCKIEVMYIITKLIKSRKGLNSFLKGEKIMKKFLTVALAGVLAASMLFTGCSKKAESKVPDKLIVGTNAEFPPFEYMNDKKQPEGFDIAMIKEIGKRMGKKVEIKNMEFKSLIGAMESDSINAIIAGMTKTEKREKAVDFSDSYYTTNQAIILKKDSKITKLAQLDGKKDWCSGRNNRRFNFIWR